MYSTLRVLKGILQNLTPHHDKSLGETGNTKDIAIYNKGILQQVYS